MHKITFWVSSKIIMIYNFPVSGKILQKAAYQVFETSFELLKETA